MVIKHGMSNTRFYKIYTRVKQRCYNKKSTRYSEYGGRGIICERETFEDFKNDMYDKYLDHCNLYGERNTTLDRINGKGNYSKDNCRRATYKVQSINRYNVRNIEVDGTKINAHILSDLCDIPTDTASWRITYYLKGKISKDCLFRKGKTDQVYKITIDGKEYSGNDLSKITGYPSRTMRDKMHKYIDGKITKEKLLKKKTI